MKKTTLFFSFLAILLFVDSAFSQRINPKNYDAFIEEVYGGTPYTTEGHKEIYIRNMSMVIVKKWDGGKYPYLDEINLRNKYNPDLRHDIGKDFNNENFNPLKYFFNFTTKQVLRVRNTDYMIVIDPELSTK